MLTCEQSKSGKSNLMNYIHLIAEKLKQAWPIQNKNLEAKKLKQTPLSKKPEVHFEQRTEC